MPPLRIAVQLRCLRLPLRQALPVAARLGVEAVELDGRGEINAQQLSETGIRQVRRLVADHGLRVAAVEFHTRRGFNEPHELERRIDATRAALRLAHALGASWVVNQVGRVPETDDDPSWRLMLDALGDLGAYGHHVGALLAAETGSESGPQLRRLLEALPSGALAVTLDPGNLIAGGFSPLEAVDALGESIGHVHARDAVYDRATGRGAETTLGRGSVEFPALLGALEQRQYRGYLSIERLEANDPAAEIGDAVKFLRSLT